jgi:cytidylate kinase
MIVAIDGPAAAGKGTLARHIAAALDFAYLETGLLYRAVGAKVLALGEAPGDAGAAERAAEALGSADLERTDLRSEAVSQAASEVAAHPGVRARLLAFQRRFAAWPPDGKTGAVLDGRDMGTVVVPEAEVKIFLTASPEARAARRAKELRERGEDAIYPRVLQEMRDRDARDSARAAAPLRPADDAIVVDTTEMDRDDVFEKVLSIVQSRLGAT